MGGGKNYPEPLNRPYWVEKVRIFENEGSENPLPTPHNPTYTQRFHYIYSNHFENACGVRQVCEFTQCLHMPVGGRKNLKTAHVE